MLGDVRGRLQSPSHRVSATAPCLLSVGRERMCPRGSEAPCAEARALRKGTPCPSPCPRSLASPMSPVSLLGWGPLQVT